MLTFVSDTILYNEYGMAAAGTDTLKKYLEEMLDITDLEIRNPFLQYTTIGGYNVTWKQRKPIIQGRASAERIDFGYYQSVIKRGI